MAALTTAMTAVRLLSPTGVDGLAVEQVEVPDPASGEALVRVHAAAITRDELEWPVDRLPAIPSYELSGVIAALGPDVADLAVGDEVWALTPFDRNGAAAQYTVVPTALLAPKPRTLGHLEAATIPLAGLSAWQGLFDHGRLREGERVVVQGAGGGVGGFATQLAHQHGAYVIGTVSSSDAIEGVLAIGADEAINRATTPFDDAPSSVDLVFDTVGGEVLAHSMSAVREGGRVVSVAEQPTAPPGRQVQSIYFVVEPNREQLIELGRLVDRGTIHAAIDSVFPLSDVRAAFERVMASGKRGKVVLQIVEE